MLDTAWLCDAVADETRIICHLAAKLRREDAGWRATPEQRSVVELLRYLARTAIAPARVAVAGDREAWKALAKQLDALEPAGFAAAMADQEREFRALVAPLDDAALQRPVKAPWG